MTLRELINQITNGSFDKGVVESKIYDYEIFIECSQLEHINIYKVECAYVTDDGEIMIKELDA